MMKLQKLFIFLCVLITFASLAQTGYCDEHQQTLYNKSDLPTGGQFVSNPKEKIEVYYFINRGMMQTDKSNAQKSFGLYHSVDNGETWSLLCSYFQFKDLFIHPVTGRLFAVIDYHHLIERNGYLVPTYADKAIMSVDGKNWKDIMGKRKYLLSLTNIFQDPDYPDRVCLAGNVLRPLILQSNDADYSDWEIIPPELFRRKHPNTPTNLFRSR